jgi:hypothetical protein
VEILGLDTVPPGELPIFCIIALFEPVLSMLSNSTTSVAAVAARQDPMTIITIISFVLGVIATLQSGLFVYAAIAGLGKPVGWTPPPEEWGNPWEFSIATGLNGATRNGSEPLEGAGGPFPSVLLL